MMVKDAKYFLGCFADTGDDDALRDTEKAIAALEAERDALREWGDKLKRFVKHKAGCGVFRTDNNKCTCELTAALAEWAKGTGT